MTSYNLNQTARKKSRSLFTSNPILKRVSKINEVAGVTSCATYKGILKKTLYFLAATVVGFVLFLLVSPMLAFGNHINTEIFEAYLPQLAVVGAALIIGLISPFIAIFARRTTPVTGTIYTVSQGIVLASFSVFYKGAYSNALVLAAVITLVIVFTMLLLFTSGKIKANEKFKTVTFVLLLTTIGISILSIIAFLIPSTRGYVIIFSTNPIFSIVMSVIFIVIASLFLISDFQIIRETVENQRPKEYEWAVSFGLAFTVIWLYFKVLELLIKVYDMKN